MILTNTEHGAKVTLQSVAIDYRQKYEESQIYRTTKNRYTMWILFGE